MLDHIRELIWGHVTLVIGHIIPHFLAILIEQLTITRRIPRVGPFQQRTKKESGWWFGTF